MSSPSVSFAAKGLVASVVTVIQALLLGAMSLNSRMVELDAAGAPVINLTLQPMVAFDGEDGGDKAAVSAEEEKPQASRRASFEPMIAPRPSARTDVEPELVVRTVELPTTVAMRAVVEVADGAENAVMPATSETGSTASANSRRGMTRGGGGQAMGASGGRSTDDYEAEVLRWIERHKGNAGGNLGVVTIGFTVDRRGRLSGEHIVKTSGRARLDAFSLDKLRQAAPFPRPSADVSWNTRGFVVNVDYRRRS